MFDPNIHFIESESTQLTHLVQGLKTWETYFLLRSSQCSSEPYKPGSNHSWFRRHTRPSDSSRIPTRNDHQRSHGQTELDTDETRVAPLGMYGTRNLPPLPRVRGRLYVNFDLVEIDWSSDSALAGRAAPVVGSSALPKATVTPSSRERFRVLPQPKLWPPSPPGKKEIQRKLDERAQSWLENSPGGRQKPFRILALDGGGVRGVFSAALLERLCSEHPTLLEEVGPLRLGSSPVCSIHVLTSVGMCRWMSSVELPRAGCSR